MREFLKDAGVGLIVLVVIIAIVCGIFFGIPAIESSCDRVYFGTIQEVPAVPENTVEQSISEWTVNGRYASSSSRSSIVNYNLSLQNEQGETSVVVSQDEFVNVPDGTIYYRYRYVVRPYNTYDERMTAIVNKAWIPVTVVGFIPFLWALSAVIYYAVEAIKDSRYVISNDDDKWHY